jgi:phosphoglycerate dehydrogenase-like enzyme
MKKIVVVQPFGLLPEQRRRLQSLGDVTFYDEMSSSSAEWLKRVKDADIICTGKFGLKEKIYELKDTFISVPFVAVHWIDSEQIKARNVVVKNSPGCNKEPVSEWIVGMIINLMRRLPTIINTKKRVKGNPSEALSLVGKTVCISGAGNIGTLVGKILKSLGMNVTYFKRGNDLIKKVKGADVIVDVLGANDQTYKIYNRDFFQSLKKGSFFITVTGDKLWDADAMIEALDQRILAGIKLAQQTVHCINALQIILKYMPLLMLLMTLIWVIKSVMM